MHMQQTHITCLDPRTHITHLPLQTNTVPSATRTHADTGHAEASARLAMRLQSVTNDPSTSLSLEKPEACGSLIQSCFSQRAELCPLADSLMQRFTTGNCHPYINISRLPWADWGLCLSVEGCWGLQSHLLSSLILNLRRNWQCIKSKFHATSHSPKEHLGNNEEAPATVRDRGGVGVGGEDGGQGKEEAERMKNVTRRERVDLFSFIHFFRNYLWIPSFLPGVILGIWESVVPSCSSHSRWRRQ